MPAFHRTRSRYSTLAAVTAVVVLAGDPALAREVPFLSGRVNDTAGLLSEEARLKLEQRLEQLERRSGAQVAILTIDSLEGDVLEDYSMRVVETWKLGRKGVDDGVLLLIAKNDRKMRLEVGYGLESKLSDIACTRILDNLVKPRFRAGEFGAGIEAGIDAVVATIDGKTDAIPAEAPSGGTTINDAPWFARVAGFGIFALVVGIFSLLAIFSKGCVSWFLYLFLMPFHLAFPAAFIHPAAGAGFFLAWLIGFPVLKLVLGKTAAGKAFLARHPNIATFSSSSSGSSWGSGSSWSSGDSGFSGGGGSFGGGGSSSSW